MDPFIGGSLIQAGTSALGGLVGGLLGRKNQNRQQRLNRDMYEFQKTMALHGTQYRAADMEAAGLSKTLAAGNAATTSVQSSPEHAGNAPVDEIMAGATMGSDVGKSIAEVGLMESMRDKADAETKAVETQNARSRFDLEIAEATRAFTIQEAQNRARITRNQADQTYYNMLKSKLGPAMARADLSKTKQENIILNATELLMKLEKENREWYHDRDLPYDIGWDQWTRGPMMLTKSLTHELYEMTEDQKSYAQQERERRARERAEEATRERIERGWDPRLDKPGSGSTPWD